MDDTIIRRGDQVEVKGHLFYVDRINVSSLVLRPVLPVGREMSQRRVMRLFTGQPGVYLGADEDSSQEAENEGSDTSPVG